jgi:AraC-like DNA-binding protein
MTETPAAGNGGTPTDGLDVLSDALRVVRASGALLLRGEFHAPWTLAAPESSSIARLVCPGHARLVILHIVAEGECWVDVPKHERVVLSAGDLILFPQGQCHTLGFGEATPVPVSELLPPPPWAQLPVLRLGSAGAVTHIVCCYLRCDDALFNPLLDSLPPVLRVRASDAAGVEWVRSSVRYLVGEATRGAPGAGALAGRLTELLFVEVLRLHMSRLHAREVGWLAALRDRYVSRALAAFHARPEHTWTLAALARHVGLSRSALLDRFARLLDMSPMRYLTLWRLQLAAQRLQHASDSIGAIARSVGYGSEEAFGRAFKRFAGMSPGAWRHAAADGHGADANVRHGVAIPGAPRATDTGHSTTN